MRSAALLVYYLQHILCWLNYTLVDLYVPDAEYNAGDDRKAHGMDVVGGGDLAHNAFGAHQLVFNIDLHH